MSVKRVLIADDEPIPRNIMKEFCERSALFNDIEVARDAIEAMQYLMQQRYDLVLLDIQMPMLSGLDLAKSIPAETQVIFVTAYAEHALEAFSLNALDYLLKPVSYERFLQAVQKMHTSQTALDKSHKDYVMVKQGRKNLRLKLMDILYVESKGNQSVIYMASQESIPVYITLSSILQSLPAHTFAQVHRSFIVNTKHVEAFENKLIYIAGQKLPVGEQFRKGLSFLE